MVDQVKNACCGCILNEETVIKCNDAQDAVNNFLKTASKLTSIEENSELSSGKNNRINFHNRIFSHTFFLSQVEAAQSQQCVRCLESEAA